MKRAAALALLGIASFIAACTPGAIPGNPGATPLPTAAPLTTPIAVVPTATPTPEPSHSTSPVVRFANVGDFGAEDVNTRDPMAESVVAQMVNAWNPDFVVAPGDLAYPNAADAARLDFTVRQFYGKFMTNNQATNRLFASIGNHDTDVNCTVFSDYFANAWPTGNNNVAGVTGLKADLFYSITKGATAAGTPMVEIFFFNSSTPGNNSFYGSGPTWGDGPPNYGLTVDGVQYTWLKNALQASNAKWKIVMCHHTSYSSVDPNSEKGDGDNANLQWPFQAWGADVVFQSHAHLYEVLRVTDANNNDFLYVVNGAGGRQLEKDKDLTHPHNPYSVYLNNHEYGAMLVSATESQLLMDFYGSGYIAGGPRPPVATPKLLRRDVLTKP